MSLSLKCPECRAVSEYSMDDLIGNAATIYRDTSDNWSAMPDPMVVSCKKCPKQFKVSLNALKQSVSANYQGGTHDR